MDTGAKPEACLPRLRAARRAEVALPPQRSALTPAYLDAWPARASRSRLKPIVRLARTFRAHRDGILAAVRLGLSNGRLGGLDTASIRLISHRGFGFHSADALIALVYPWTGVAIDLPR